MNWLANLGRQGISTLHNVGRATVLLLQILRSPQTIVTRFRDFVAQLYAIGVLSLLIISVSGVFVGMVLALQGYYILTRFAAESTLGVFIAASLLRELGPVVTALLFAGRAGSALTAEIGLMKATEQLSALEMMAVNPVSRLLVPRFFAGLIAMPLLATVFNALGILGGYFVAVGLMDVDVGTFWAQMQSVIEFRHDIVNGLIKSFVFGLLVSWIALFQGYHAVPTSEGISRATTRTVVHSSLAVLAMDFVLTALMFGD